MPSTIICKQLWPKLPKGRMKYFICLFILLTPLTALALGKGGIPAHVVDKARQTSRQSVDIQNRLGAFSKYDYNKDGIIKFDEIYENNYSKELIKGLEALDKNNDKQISPDEFLVD